MAPLTEQETAALDAFHAVAHRADVRTAFRLEAGEAVLINNLTVLHARTAFRDHDDPARRRLLLRLWLTVPGGRPVVPEIRIYDGGREGGVPPQPGRLPSYARRTEFERIPGTTR